MAGSGAWMIIHPVYDRYAQTFRFHVDARRPRSPEAKGEVQRRVRAGRAGCTPFRAHPDALDDLEASTDVHPLETMRQWITCLRAQNSPSI